MATRLKIIADWLTTVLVAVAAGVFIWTQVQNRWLRPRPAPKIEELTNLSMEGSTLRHVKGRGRIALIEFTDYECSFCGEYARTTAPAVDTLLVDSALLRHIVVNFPLERTHPHAKQAAEAAECADRQGRYWEMHARLFKDRTKLEPDALMQSGVAIGLDEPSFASCLSGKVADRVSADMREGVRLGVRVTPTFLLGIVRPDGSIDLRLRIAGVVSIDDLKRIVGELRQHA